MVTDQTSAHDPLNGYLPKGWSLDKAEKMRISDPETVVEAASASIAEHVQAMLDLCAMGIPTFDYGNNIRQVAFSLGGALW